MQEEEPFASPSHPGKTHMKPWTSLIDRKRPRYHRDNRGSHGGDFGTDGGDEIDILYDGYFRGLFTGGDGARMPNGNGIVNENGNRRHVRRFLSRASHSNGNDSHAEGETHSNGRRFDRDHHNYEISSGRLQFVTGSDYETPAGRRHGMNPSSSGSLYSSSGSDIASHSYNSTADLGSSDATTAQHEFSSHRDEAGPSERWMRPVPSMSISGRSIVPPLNRSGSLGDPSRAHFEAGEHSTGTSGGRHTGQVGPGNSVLSLGSGGFARGRIQSDNVEDPVQNGSQILRGIKQRLLSFIVQGIQNDDSTPAFVSLSHFS